MGKSKAVEDDAKRKAKRTKTRADEPESPARPTTATAAAATPQYTPAHASTPATMGSSRASPASRYDSSLGLLTKKFVDLIQSSTTGDLDLNSAAVALGVQKRRIYDITNVLEGIGLIEKTSKNNIHWKGASGAIGNSENHQDMDHLLLTISELMKEERKYDQHIKVVSQGIRRLYEEEAFDKGGFESLSYITHDDMRSLDSFTDQSVMAIKAPPGTTLEVPDPDEGMPSGKRRYQIFLKSSDGPVDVYLVRQLPEGEDSADASLSAAAPSAAPQSPAAPTVDQKSYDSDSGLFKLAPLKTDPDFCFNLDETEGISDFFSDCP